MDGGKYWDEELELGISFDKVPAIGLMFTGHQRAVTQKREGPRTIFKTLVQKPKGKNWGSGWGQLPELRETSNDKIWDLNSSKRGSKLSS